MTDRVTTADRTDVAESAVHPNQSLLDKLHVDSMPTKAEVGTSTAKNLVIDGVLSAPAVLGPVTLGRSLMMGYKALDVTTAVASEVLGTAAEREAAAIKREFKEQLPETAIKDIEQQCEPTTGRKVWKGLTNVYGDGVIPFMSGVALAPATGGWSIPIALGLGTANGVRKLNNDLNYERMNCQVDQLRKMLTSSR